jgi:hypothetical protein
MKESGEGRLSTEMLGRLRRRMRAEGMEMTCVRARKLRL